MAVLTVANGVSIVRETIFEKRFMHVNELQRMGAVIGVRSGEAVIEGVPHLSGADVRMTDLRAGAALVIAGLAATGTTVVHGLQHLSRGYENLIGKLCDLGAKIEPI
jgi:UDP-N-acetylglucosamine 1-carboxyvinyltransferase